MILAVAALVALGCIGRVEDRLEEVRALQDAGEFSESVEPLRQVLERHPDLPEANYLLGVALVNSGNPTQAVWPLEKAAADSSHAVSSGLLLAQTFLTLKAYDDAIAAATRVLAVEPDEVQALQVRAQARLGANDRPKALEDTTRLLELQPDDFATLLTHATILAELGRLEEADRAHRDLEALAARSGDPDEAARGCLARASFFEDNVRDDAKAEDHFRQCLTKYPADLLGLRLFTAFLDQRERTDEATGLWEAAVRQEPENLILRASLASRYEAAGRVDDARAVLRAGTRLLGTAGAWYQLAEFERRADRPAQALEAVERAIELSPGQPESLVFLRADLLVDLGRTDEAEGLLDSFEQPAYRDLLRGRILLARDDLRGALASLEEGLKRWPNNPGGRYLAGLAAYRLGDFQRAESELREAVRADARATDAGLLLARLHLQRGEYHKAAERARSFVANRGGSRPEGYVVFIQASVARHHFEAARRTVDALRTAGFPVEASVELAAVEAAQHGPADAVRALRSSDLDPRLPEHEPVLRALADYLLAAGDGDEALAEVTRASQSHPDVSGLRELEGTVLMRLDRDAEARSAFEDAARLDPGNARAWAGLAELAARTGDRTAAIELYDRAAAAAPDDPGFPYAAAQLTLAGGDRNGARERLENLIRAHPAHPGALNDLAWLLAESGSDLDRAARLAATAREIAPGPEISDTAGWIQVQRGDLEAAMPLLEEAARGRPESATVQYHLGVALARRGDREGARRTLEAALQLGPFPESDAARREVARLEPE